MSRAEPFLMTPFSLLKTPEYGRFFDGGPLGFIYRFLRTGIRRQGVSDLRFVNESGWVTELARLYDEGWLAAYVTHEKLVDASGFSKRSISNHLKKLVELKLVRLTEFGEGYIALMGKRLMYSTASGYSVGSSHEGFFIDEWESWVAKDEYGFRKMLIESLAPEGQSLKFFERLEKDFSADGKILREGGKNFSKSEQVESGQKPRPEQDNLDTTPTPRIDKVRIDTKTTAPPTGGSGEVSDKGRDFNQMLNVLRGSKSDQEARRLAKEAVAAGVPLAMVNQVLTSRLDNPRYTSLPRLSMNLAAMENPPKKPHTALANLWFDLSTDITGAPEAKSTYASVSRYFRDTLLTAYSFEQCLWTLHQVIDNPNDLKFVAQSGRNFGSVMPRYAQKWQELLDERRRSEIESAAARRYDEERAAREKARTENTKEMAELSEYAKRELEKAREYSERQKRIKGYLSGGTGK